jgi:aconitate hydratase
MDLPILLKVGDDISTDEIMPAGARVLPYRSNIPKISEFAFEILDPTYSQRAAAVKSQQGHAILGGENYGQGSSREHAALAPRYLGLRLVIARSFARIHQQNLVNFGVLPVKLVDPSVYDLLVTGDTLEVKGLHNPEFLSGADTTLVVSVPAKSFSFTVIHDLSQRELEVLLAGGMTNWIRSKAASQASKRS